MSRQRMVSDDFWKDPDLVDLTTEQRTALLLFLTCEESNIVGVYRVIWRAVGAGMGWTHDQILNAARDLKRKGCVDIHEESGWVWVKEWWKHNSLKGAFTGNVAKKAFQELSQVPDFWAETVRKWISDNDPEGACKPLLSPLQGASKSLGSPLQGAGGNTTTNRTSISNPTTTTTVCGGALLEGLEVEPILAPLWPQLAEVLVQAAVNDPAYAQDLLDELAGTMEAGNRGERAKIGNPASWLQALIDGDFTRARCYEIQERRRGAREREERQQAEKRRAEEAAAAGAERTAEAEAFLESLDSSKRTDLLNAFGDYLSQHNIAVHRLFRQSSLDSKLVQAELIKFLPAWRAEYGSSTVKRRNPDIPTI